MHQINVSHCLQPQQNQEHEQEKQGGFQTNQCSTKCGNLEIPFPFYLNSSSSYSCGNTSQEIISDAFRLSCVEEKQDSQVLYLNIGSQSYKVIQFFTDGVLVDYLPDTSSSSSTASCTIPHVNLDAFGFEGNDYFGISIDNMVGLYECEDSSLCKLPQHSCEKEQNGTCVGSGNACCYPLSDIGEELDGGGLFGFSVFSQFGCRGFSCWVVVPASSNMTTNTRKRGVKLEWAIPRNSSKAECSLNAYTINATSVPSGIRCQCSVGLVGNAFAHGLGCSKSCLKDGRKAFGKDCFYKKSNHTRKVNLLVGLITSALSLASLTAFFCLLKGSTNKSTVLLNDKYNEGANTSFGKVSKPPLFSYDELEQATKGFDDSKKLVEGTKGELYSGILGDGSHVAVHKLHKNGRDQHQYLTEEKELVFQSVEFLSTVAHKNLANVLGCCIDTSLMVVYEYPNYGTLEKHLMRSQDDDGVGLEWGKRLKIASETASLLSFLRYKISLPVIHQELNPGFIFVDNDSCVKIAGFIPLNGYLSDTNSNSGNYAEGVSMSDDDVYNIGLLLVDLLCGVGEQRSTPATALRKIQNGKVAEIVDPLIYYDEHREEIDFVADLATRCLLFGSKLGMKNVATELMQTYSKYATTSGLVGSTSSNTAGSAELKETFSNSSLLQMMSMSPDSIYAPHFSV